MKNFTWILILIAVASPCSNIAFGGGMSAQLEAGYKEQYDQCISNIKYFQGAWLARLKLLIKTEDWIKSCMNRTGDKSGCYSLRDTMHGIGDFDAKRLDEWERKKAELKMRILENGYDLPSWWNESEPYPGYTEINAEIHAKKMELLDKVMEN